MNQPMSPESFTAEDAAAFWFARARSGQMTEEERVQFQTWKQDPANDSAYRVLQGVWNATTLVPVTRLRALTEEPVHKPLHTGRRRTLWVLGTVCAAGVGAVVLPKWVAGFPEFDDSLTTALGQRREVTLPDASVIAMNTATQLNVRLYKNKRIVTLASGEATFTVTKDANRPFYVETGATTVRVTGTQFNVRRDTGNVRVTVISGSVEVNHTQGDTTAQVLLGANDTVFVADTTGPGAVEKTDATSVLAWHQGRVVFFNTPLSSAIGEINRYITHPITITDPAVAKMRIAGVFNIDNPATFLRLLPEIAPVAVRTQPDGSTLVVLR